MTSTVYKRLEVEDPDLMTGQKKSGMLCLFMYNPPSSGGFGLALHEYRKLGLKFAQ